jgi:hypothetical protein
MDFYEWARGGWREFLFHDPTANLLVESEDPGGNSWVQGNGLMVTPGGQETGRGRESYLQSPGGMDGFLAQNVAAESGFSICFSAEARSSSGGALELQVGDASSRFPLKSDWRRVHLAGRSEGTLCQMRLMLLGGASAETREIQAEAQPFPSTYRPSSPRSGVHTGVRFLDQSLRIEATGPGVYRAEVTLESLEEKL